MGKRVLPGPDRPIESRKGVDGVKDSLAAAKVSALMLYIALAAGVFGTMARSFGWL
jgi:hypothetical protein